MAEHGAGASSARQQVVPGEQGGWAHVRRASGRSHRAKAGAVCGDAGWSRLDDACSRDNHRRTQRWTPTRKAHSTREGRTGQVQRSEGLRRPGPGVTRPTPPSRPRGCVKRLSRPCGLRRGREQKEHGNVHRLVTRRKPERGPSESVSMGVTRRCFRPGSADREGEESWKRRQPPASRCAFRSRA